MLEPKLIDDISKKVAASLPSGLRSLQDDIQRNIHSTLEGALTRLNLVTREEFEVQQAVLLRTRGKLAALELRLQELEEELKNRSTQT